MLELGWGGVGWDEMGGVGWDEPMGWDEMNRWDGMGCFEQ